MDFADAASISAAANTAPAIVRQHAQQQQQLSDAGNQLTGDEPVWHDIQKLRRLQREGKFEEYRALAAYFDEHLPPLPPDMRKLGTLDSDAKRRHKADWMAQHGIEYKDTQCGIDRAFAQVPCTAFTPRRSPVLTPVFFPHAHRLCPWMRNARRHANDGPVLKLLTRATHVVLMRNAAGGTPSARRMRSLRRSVRQARPASNAAKDPSGRGFTNHCTRGSTKPFIERRRSIIAE